MTTTATARNQQVEILAELTYAQTYDTSDYPSEKRNEVRFIRVLFSNGVNELLPAEMVTK